MNLHIPQNCDQIILVKTDSLSSSKCTLSLLERNGDKWIIKIDDVDGNLGKNGSAWGLGLHSNPNGSALKKEGDLTSPLGIFEIGDVIFGKPDQSFELKGFEYLQLTDRDIFVDDPKHPRYNQHLRMRDDESIADYSSSENLLRDDHLYDYIVEIKHNPDCLAGEGSAIFMHVQRDVDRSTGGCYSVAEDALLSFIKLLDKAKNPLLVAVTADLAQEIL